MVLLRVKVIKDPIGDSESYGSWVVLHELGVAFIRNESAFNENPERSGLFENSEVCSSDVGFSSARSEIRDERCDAFGEGASF
jgi:hypothetical protein